MKKMTKSGEKGMLKMTCPKCKTAFGLDTNFVERTGEVNFHYTCPYCKHEAKIKG